MAILRSDQSQVTFAAEAAQGGDPELNSGTRHTGGFNGLINDSNDLPAGSTQITYDNGSNTLYVGDFIRIGNVNAGSSESSSDADTSTATEYEIRRVVHFTGTTAGIIYLDRPTAFFHANNEIIINIESTASTGSVSYITDVPGVYESVSVPDMAPTIEPRYFLGTTAKRQPAEFYAGQQTFSGGISDMVLLNANPLRFPIGKMTTVPSSVASDTILLDGAVKKGDIFIDCDGADVGNLAVNDYIQITDASGATDTSEVRQIIAEPGTDIFRLDKPLRFDHPDDSQIHEVSGGASPTGYFTHTITPTNDLDTISMHVHMRDSSETAANDFNRRFFGGMVDSATISADEGGLLAFGWDTINFLGMTHNQADQATVANNIYADGGGSEDAGMPKYSIMNSITSSDISFPSNNPYYFSQGSISLFGQEIARIRSFNISISNQTEPRYYISGRYGRNRGPNEIREGRKAYTMSCTLALPDTTSASANTFTGTTGALEIFKQLLLEGNYGDAAGAKGFAVQVVFTRGTNDSITIDIPGDGSAGTGINNQGAFITGAPHNITGDGSAMQVDVDMIFRDLKITVLDSTPSYA